MGLSGCRTCKSDGILARSPSIWVLPIAHDGVPEARIVLASQVDDRGLVFYINQTRGKSVQLEAHPVVSAVNSRLDVHRQVHVCRSVRRIGDAQGKKYCSFRPRESQLGTWHHHDLE